MIVLKVLIYLTPCRLDALDMNADSCATYIFHLNLRALSMALKKCISNIHPEVRN